MTEISSARDFQLLTKTFARAATDTGVSFDFLVKTAARESGFRSEAKAAGSSAAGMFQFIEQTWLAMVSRYGAAQGLGAEASAITRDESGRYAVKNSALKGQILNLRHDPKIATNMAAQLTLENTKVLRSKLGRAPTNGELYVAHFMGAASAGDLLQAARQTPSMDATKLFPKQAAANPAIFSTSSGRTRTVAEVANNLVKAHSTVPEAGVDSATNQRSQPVATVLSGLARSSILELSPMVIRLLSELSAPGAADRPLNK